MLVRNEAVLTEINAKEVVLSFVKALNDDDFETARNYLTDDMVFVGVLGSRNGAEAYIQDMERMRLKYNIKKAFVDGDDVCLLYDLTISGLNLLGCGWYKVENGKINSLRVVFDPRPILEQSGKK